MTTSVDTILTYTAIDLHPYEARGVRYGVNNAKTTGPVYVGGAFYPTKDAITGSATFLATDSSFITGFTVSNYSISGLDMKAGDILIADSTTYTVKTVVSSTSLELDKYPGRTGTFPLTGTLTQREYLIEPDALNNSFVGSAEFVSGSQDVIGVGTNWGPSDVTTGDQIKHDGWQKFFSVKEVVTPQLLRLTSGYTGDSTTGSYTAQKARIGRERIQYTKDNFSYDNQTTKWKYDATTACDGTTALYPLYESLANGIDLSFTAALNKSAPDIMEVSAVNVKTFSRETQFDAFQFPLPVVPNPETSLKVFVNNVALSRFPEGSRDYVVSYSPNPIYEFPQAYADRKVASLMFLKGAQNTLSPAATVEGFLPLLGVDGVNISGIMPRSEIVKLDGADSTWGSDYVVEYNSGVGAVVDHIVNEPVVKYVAANRTSFIDLGFSVTLDGTAQQCSFPPQVSDDIVFQPRVGRFKPTKQDHPSPDQEYLFTYMVEGDSVRNEPVSVVGSTFTTKFWPIKRDSILLQKGTTVLLAEQDFHPCYMTGTIILSTPAQEGDVFVISYVPLSEQKGGMSFKEDKWFTTSYGSLDQPLFIDSPADLRFSTLGRGFLLTDTGTEVLQIYNATRDATYSLNAAAYTKTTVALAKSAQNTAIGLDSSDMVYANIKFASETLEFRPVVINDFVAPVDADRLYIDGTDVASYFPVDTVVGLQQPDSAVKHMFLVESASYVEPYTLVVFKSAIPEDLKDPILTVADAPIEFVPVPLTADPFMKGAALIGFKGPNRHRWFRRDTILRIGDDLYAVSGASYQEGYNVVSLASPAMRDTTDATVLSSITRSDHPLYAEGTVDLNAVDPIVRTPDRPGMVLNYKGLDTVAYAVDSSALYLADSSYQYSLYPTLGDMSGAIAASDLSLQVWAITPAWPSRTLAITDQTRYAYLDSSAVLNAGILLRSDGLDTYDYEYSPQDGVRLHQGLVAQQRMNLDYMGYRFLDETSVSFSLNYFTILPKKSKVQASFQFDNLDQFYVQVLSRKDFFETVSIPRMKEESQQLNGNVGYGGDVVGDEGQGNSSGGLTDKEYRRKDAEIEARVFKDIYDFFSHRLQAYGDEYLAAEGLRLFNVDGMFNDAQQLQATKSYNRIFNQTDYTGMPPLRANSVTGEYTNSGVKFHDTTVTSGVSQDWTKKIAKGDFIGRAGTTKRYKIASVLNDSTVKLEEAFAETPSSSFESYTASALYPIYDDDGNIGPKFTGTKSGDFGLSLQRIDLPVPPSLSPAMIFDTFDIKIDGVSKSYTFTQIAPNPLSPLFPIEAIVAAMSSPPLLTATQVAQMLTAGIPGIKVTNEVILDPSRSYGYDNGLVIRGDGTVNRLELMSSSGVSKLGFIPGAVSLGNKDRTANDPETTLLRTEKALLQMELPYVQTIVNAAAPNKLTRLNYLAEAGIAYTLIGSEATVTGKQVTDLQKEMDAATIIAAEPLIVPSYGDATYAYDQAAAIYPSTLHAWQYDSAIYPGWEGKDGSWQWVLDFDATRQLITGKDSLGIGTSSTGVGITPIDGETQFFLQVPVANDRRILLSAVIEGDTYGPDTTAIVDGSSIPGYWLTLDPLVPVYSAANKSLFVLGETDPLFSIQLDRTSPVPQINTSATQLTLYWNEDEGSVAKEFKYSSFPKLSDMTAAIDSSAGFGIIPVHAGNYDYTNFAPYTTAVGSGAYVLTGPGSPVFEMKRVTNYAVGSTQLVVGPSTLPFSVYPYLVTLTANFPAGYVSDNILDIDFPAGNMVTASGDVSSAFPGTVVRYNGELDLFKVKFDLSAPSYRVTTTNIDLSWSDCGASGSATAVFSGNPKVGDLISQLGSPRGFVAIPTVSSGYDYTSIQGVMWSPVPSPATPALLLAGPNCPAFGVWSTTGTRKITINSTEVMIESDFGVFHHFTYVLYPTLGDLLPAIDSVPGFSVTVYYSDMGYQSTNLVQMAATTISNTAPGTTINFQDPVPVISIGFAASNPTYQSTSSAFILSQTDGVSIRTVSKAYATYPTLGALVTSIQSEAGWDAELTLNSYFYTYEPLKSTFPVPVDAVVFTPVVSHANPELFEIAMTSALPDYFADTTAIALKVAGYGKYEFLYSAYPTLAALEAGIATVPSVSVTPFYNSSYAYGYLETTAGQVQTSGSMMHFSMFHPAPLFRVFFEMSSLRYNVDRTALNIQWEEHGDTTGRNYNYVAYPTVGAVKAAVNLLPGVDATGAPIYESRASRAFRLDNLGPYPQGFSPLIDSTIYPGLRPLYVGYETISERILTDRTDFIAARVPVIDPRIKYLDETRGPQIYRDLGNEEILRSDTGDVGDLWTWANNRFNRRQGSEARLKQAEAIIASDQAAFQVNKGILG